MGMYLNTDMRDFVGHTLKVVKAKLIAATAEGGLGLSPEKIHQYTLRSQLPLKAGESRYNFKLDQDRKTTQYTKDILLNKNDAFAVAFTFVRVCKAKKNAEGNLLPHASNWLTAPDMTIFNAASAGGVLTEAEQIRQIYNSMFEWKASSETIINPIDTSVFEYQNSNNSTASNYTSNGLNGEYNGGVRLEKQFVLFGSKDNEINIYMPDLYESDLIAGDPANATVCNMIEVKTVGLLIKDGASPSCSGLQTPSNGLMCGNYLLIG